MIKSDTKKCSDKGAAGTMDRNKNISVRENFIRTIENKILSGELEIGQQLPTARELCRQMGVSLTIVNAGISELAAKGFVEVKPRHGMYVADYKLHGTTETLVAIMRYNGGKLSDHDIRSYCESRCAIDPFVVKLVIERASREQLRELGLRLDKLLKAQDMEECCDSITDFFNLMYFLSDNTFFSLIYNSTIKPQKEMYAMFIRKNGAGLIKENAQKVYDCICRGDAEAAVKESVHAMELATSGSTSII